MRRKAIKSKDILRVSIINPKELLLQKARDKLEYLTTLGAATENDVLAAAYYYSYKCRELYSLSGFNALSKKDPTHHKNWKPFANVCKLCIRNNWDTMIYIDSQFDRAEYWKDSDGRIFPQQLCSERAVAHYHKYIKGKIQEHEADGTTFKAASIHSVDEEILKTLVQDCNLIKNGIEFSDIEGTDSEKKTLILFNNWLSLSAYYISTCDWLIETLEEYYNDTHNADTLKTLDKVNKVISSNKLRESTRTLLKKIEKKLSIPETLSKRDLMNSLE